MKRFLTKKVYVKTLILWAVAVEVWLVVFLFGLPL